MNIAVIPDKFNNEQTNLCDNIMKIHRQNFFYRKILPISFILFHQGDTLLQRGLFFNKALVQIGWYNIENA